MKSASTKTGDSNYINAASKNSDVLNLMHQKRYQVINSAARSFPETNLYQFAARKPPRLYVHASHQSFCDKHVVLDISIHPSGIQGDHEMINFK